MAVRVGLSQITETGGAYGCWLSSVISSATGCLANGLLVFGLASGWLLAKSGLAQLPWEKKCVFSFFLFFLFFLHELEVAVILFLFDIYYCM